MSMCFNLSWIWAFLISIRDAWLSFLSCVNETDWWVIFSRISTWLWLMLRYFVRFMFLSTWLIHRSFLMQIDKVMNITYKYVLIFVDHFIKMKHLILITSMKVEEVINCFYAHVWKHHDLLRIFMSDQDTQFIFNV